MIKKMTLVIPVIVVVALVAALSGTRDRAAGASPSQNAGGISYASLPSEAALYLNDMVFARDSVVLPNDTVRVLLPPGTFPNTLILTENGARVRNYRITPQGADVYYSQADFRYDNVSSYGGGGASYSVTWEPSVGEDAQTREIQLDYLMSGAHWTPSYDMQILSDIAVNLAFFAEISNTSLVLDETTLYLVAGRVDLSQQMDQVSQVTFNQMAVGYADSEAANLPAMGVGSVNLQHVYALGAVSANPGDIVYANLVTGELSARRLLVWNASASQSVDVIYKVTNNSEMPFAEGIVRNYQDNLFIGSDFIETTPPGSEGSVTVSSLPDVRVFRTESSEYQQWGYCIRGYGSALNKSRSIVLNWDPNAWRLNTPDAGRQQITCCAGKSASRRVNP
jgi:hypothetical protein